MGTTKTNTTANATVKKQTEWKLKLFVQPDPFAEKVDNKATATAASDTKALAAIDKITKAKYGSPKVAAAEVTEKAVKWVKKPAATKEVVTLQSASTAAKYNI